jgi:pimeloyl-ACP methyl ester carboxylesterase
VVAAEDEGVGVTASERTVTVWDPPLESKVFEAGSGDTVVYLHGGGGVTAGDPLLEALAQRFHVVAPLHPGFTDPDDVEEIRDVHDLALYHDELFDSLGLDSVPVIGHSFGGMVGAELAAHVPNRVSKLVLAAPVGLWNDDYPMADMFTAFPFEINNLLWADPNSGEAQQAMATMAEEFADLKVDDPMVAMLQRVLPGLITIGKYMWPLPDKGLVRRLRRIKAPTLVVWGEKDKLIPSRYADDFVAGIPDARAAFVPDAGHMMPFEKTDEFVGLVGEFLG